MKLIGNEIKHAEKCLKQKSIDKKQNVKTLIVLIKYYHHYLKKTHTEIKELLNDFLDSVPNRFNRDYLEELIGSMAKDDVPINVVEKVCITEAEMRVINTRESEQERRVLFTMLVHYKVKNELYPQNNNKVSEEHSTIFKDAKVTCSQKDKYKIINKLSQDGLIDLPVNLNDSRITLNYVNNDSPTVIEVSSYDDLIMDYYIYKGSKVINCKECGTRVLVKGKSRTQYCPSCKKEKELEQDRIYQQNKYKNAKNPNIS